MRAVQDCGPNLMPRIAPDQLAELRAAIQAHDFLHSLVREVENHHRLVFHSLPKVDWSKVQPSAEQIVIAELCLRYRGKVEGMYKALEDLQRRGREWSIAIREMAGRIHSYYTTPLGMRLRLDLFGDEGVFISPERALVMSAAFTRTTKKSAGQAPTNSKAAGPSA